jgi:amino acid adenylation domain-containing protein/non-ribosomal peptide synthase protein (TIGR01720 family)
LLESNVSLLITENKYSKLIEKLVDIPKYYINDFDFNKIEEVDFEAEYIPNASAYIFYTSGSTGKPKGAVNQYDGMLNHLLVKIHDLNIKEDDVVGQVATQSFDVSVWQMISAMLVGGKTVIFKDEEAWQPEPLLRLMAKEKVTIFQTVPSHIRAIIDAINSCLYGPELSLKTLNYLIINGEALHKQICEDWFLLYPEVPIINAYGFTECSDDVSHLKVTNEFVGKLPKIVQLDGPVANLQIYVLDKYLNPLPIGAIGEIYIGGIGVGRGYFNRPDLTAEKFIPNPFRSELELKNSINSRLYKSGDLGRWSSDRTIIFEGRCDFQVKIRGHRIELGEIENVMLSYKDVSQSVVIVKERGTSSENKYLAGYYTASSTVDTDLLTKYLSSRIPEYMVPSLLVQLDKLPLTINGKIDRKSLPDILPVEENKYFQARCKTEEKICKIWSEVLGVPEYEVGIRDDFFKLGGDSITSIQLVSRIRQILGLNISIKDIFLYRTIEKIFDSTLSKINDSLNQQKFLSEQGILEGEVKLLPIQEWFFKSGIPLRNHWNQSFLIKINELNIHKLEDSLIELIKHHDAFRLRYKTSDMYGEIVQYYSNTNNFNKLQLLDVTTLGYDENSVEFRDALNDKLTEWQSSFSLEHGPVYSVGYLYGYKNKSARIFFAMHHLIVDSISWRIISDDLQRLYNNQALGHKGTSYRQWAETVNQYAKINHNEKNYWNNLLSDYDLENLSNYCTTNNTETYTEFRINPELTKNLLHNVGKVYNTQINDILLSVLGYVLQEMNGNIINFVTLEGHGREDIAENIDISSTVGWFTSMYPVKLEIKETIDATIKDTKEKLRSIPHKGLGYGPLFGYNDPQLPKILFNYLGQFNQEVQQDQLKIWHISNEDSGLSKAKDNKSNNLIEVNGWIINNELQFFVLSKIDNFDAKTIAKLFKTKLIEIIAHLQSTERRYLTPSDVYNIIDQNHLDKLQSSKDLHSIYLANSLQQGFIYHSLKKENLDDAYIVQLVWNYNVPIDQTKLKKAWEYAQMQYPALRLRFNWENQLLQIIDKRGILNWQYQDFSGEVNIDVIKEKTRLIQELDRTKAYKLDEGNLFRIYLIKQKNDLYTCIFSNHHSILDGWSNGILMNYVHSTYIKLLNDETIEVKADQSYEKAQYYLQENKNSNIDFWNSYLLNVNEKINLTHLISQNKRFDLKHDQQYDFVKNPKRKKLLISSDTYIKLKNLQENAVTLSSILQYCWHYTLSVYTNSSQTIVGTLVSGRNIPINNIENSVGLYINTLPVLVNHHQRHLSIIERIQRLQNDINEFNTKPINLADLGASKQRLFDTLFIYENYPDFTLDEIQNTLKIQFCAAMEKFDYPIALVAYEVENGIELVIQYGSEFFSDNIINSLLDSLVSLAYRIANQDKYNNNILNYFPEADINDYIKNHEPDIEVIENNLTIQKSFEKQVEKTPSGIAFSYANCNVTYQVLNERSNKIANYLIQKYQIKSDELIGLFVDRPYVILAILATLKSGGAYVPIATNTPHDRVILMISDAKPKVILTNGENYEYLTSLHISNLNPIIISLDKEECFAEESITNPITSTNSQNLAYVSYTSGSTGKPKGVMIEHYSYLSAISSIKDLYFKYSQNISTISLTNYVFDIFGLEYGLSLLTGGNIYLSDKESNIKNLTYYDFIQMTPSLCDLYMEKLVGINIKLFVGGENLPFNLLNKILDKNIDVVNLYGPTESTIWSASHDFSRYINKPTKPEYVSFGQPLRGEKVYVLDKNMNHLPHGAIGELYISGIGLARGYLNNPTLTAEKFIANPFIKDGYLKNNVNLRLYKTGDLVRYTPNTGLEYIGRSDFQIKIRGFRIEIEEIENAILNYQDITNTVVILHDDKDLEKKYLLAYYVANKLINTADLYHHLSSQLPHYMVPTNLIKLDQLPLTNSGKINREALPKDLIVTPQTLISPRNYIEEKMHNLWSNLLCLPNESIGIQNDFFSLGGNSILVIKLVDLLNKEFNSQLRIVDIFLFSTIEQLSAQIFELSDEYTPIVKLNNL